MALFLYCGTSRLNELVEKKKQRADINIIPLLLQEWGTVLLQSRKPKAVANLSYSSWNLMSCLSLSWSNVFSNVKPGNHIPIVMSLVFPLRVVLLTS